MDYTKRMFILIRINSRKFGYSLRITHILYVVLITKTFNEQFEMRFIFLIWPVNSFVRA